MELAVYLVSITPKEKTGFAFLRTVGFLTQQKATIFVQKLDNLGLFDYKQYKITTTDSTNKALGFIADQLEKSDLPDDMVDKLNDFINSSRLHSI